MRPSRLTRRSWQSTPTITAARPSVLPPWAAARTPVRAPDAYVETLFDQHAEVFEDVLVEQLGYHVPMLVRQRLQDLKLGPFKRMLDLGCGTGLTGSALNDLCEEMIGIDISENMVVIADEKEVYETLFVAEAEDFLDDNDEDPFDLITATDVLPYLGALEPLFFGAAENMKPGGIFVFSSETLPERLADGRPTWSARTSGSSIRRPIFASASPPPASSSSRCSKSTCACRKASRAPAIWSRHAITAESAIWHFAGALLMS